MRPFVLLLAVLAFTASAEPKDFAWVCVVEEEGEWLFVYEDIRKQTDGVYRIFVKWEYTNDPDISHATQTWLVSPDFDQICVLSTVGYNRQGEIAYTNYEPDEQWHYVMPETYAKSVVETAQGLITSPGL